MLYNRHEPQYRQLCRFARTFADIADTSVFNRINEFTTSEMCEQAQQSLLKLAERLESQMDLFHYASAYSPTHTCVRDIYIDAAFRLQNLHIMHQKAEQQAPTQQVITNEGTVINLEDRVKTNSEETDIGTEDTSSSP